MTRASVLCVDDEPNVLEGLEDHLHGRFALTTATSGAAALAILKRAPDTAVIVSDMKMPGMDGATFLREARLVVPDAARILLTGHADLDSAIAAVNDGGIFRFLTKPCAPKALTTAITAGVEQHRLVTAERVLLEQTLHGSIKLLTDVLALTAPTSFGKATRVRRLVTDLASALGMGERWQVEVAAMLSQLGFITVPPEIVEKAYYGRALTEAELQAVSRVPAATEQLLDNIPRLETVRAIVAAAARPRRGGPASDDSEQRLIDRAGEVLRVAVDLDELETQGQDAALAADVLLGRTERYDPEVLEALAALRRGGTNRAEVREVPVSGLKVGMTFAEDVTMSSGTLLVARGYEVTAGFLKRMQNFRPGVLREPLRVCVAATQNR